MSVSEEIIGRCPYLFKGLFITGTDTDVGKTFVSYLIARGLQRAGADFSYIKPVATGGRVIAKKLVSPDVIFLKEHLRLTADYEALNPVCLKAPLAPSVAARLEKRRIDIPSILKKVRALRKKYPFVVVEGIGGAAVPIACDYLVVDMIRDLNLPVIVVARPALGTINHTLLTVRELQRAGVKVLGMVFNQVSKGKRGIAERTSPAEISSLTRLPIIAEIPFMKRTIGREVNAVADNLIQRFATL